jgi:hypothetical protein
MLLFELITATYYQRCDCAGFMANISVLATVLQKNARQSAGILRKRK